jgi:hypothetical protein
VVINVVVSCGPVLILWIRFGAIASCFLGLLTYETTQNANASVVATGIMAIIPAHIMRSVGGGYDNESFAITAMLATCVFGADRPPPFARDAAATSPREPRTMLEAARRSSRESAALTPRPRARRCRSRALIRFCGRRWVLGLEPACGSSFLVIVVVGRGGGRVRAGLCARIPASSALSSRMTSPQLLLLVPLAAHEGLVAGGRARGHRVHLHGRDVGRVSCGRRPVP